MSQRVRICHPQHRPQHAAAFAWLLSGAIALLPGTLQAEMQVTSIGRATGSVSLFVAKSTVLTFERPLTRASITDPAIATVVILSPTELLVNGKAPGVTSLMVWDDQEQQQLLDVDVRTDETQLRNLLRELTPNDAIQVHTAQDSIVLSGEVVRPTTLKRAQEIAESFSPKVVNLLRVGETPQIMLKVRFIEINRKATQDIGLDLIVERQGLTVVSQPGKTGVEFRNDQARLDNLLFPNNTELFGSAFSLGHGRTKFDIAESLKLLEGKDLLRVLAEPNLLARSGEEASFLAGGEIPIPIATANAIRVDFKEFGIRLSFTPEVTETGVIQLKVAPEVSSVDRANGVTLGGFSIPGFRTRKAETTVELSDGETLAIGGLLSQETTQTLSKVPMAGDVPVLGDLFKSKKFNKGETELLVLVSPSLVTPSKDVPVRTLKAEPDMDHVLSAGRAPFDDVQGERMRSALGSQRDASWEPEQEADPFLRRRRAGDASSLYPRSPATTSTAWADPESMRQDPEYASTVRKFEMAAEDPAYQQIPGVLKSRITGDGRGSVVDEDPYNVYGLLGYRKPSTW